MSRSGMPLRPESEARPAPRAGAGARERCRAGTTGRPVRDRPRASHAPVGRTGRRAEKGGQSPIGCRKKTDPQNKQSIASAVTSYIILLAVWRQTGVMCLCVYMRGGL